MKKIVIILSVFMILQFTGCLSDSPDLELPSIPAEISIIPQPVTLDLKEGFFTLNASTVISAKNDIVAEVNQWVEPLRISSGFPLRVVSGSTISSNVINLDVNGGLLLLGEESYTIDVDKTSIEIEAAAPEGFFYAFQTLKQLLPADIYSFKRASDVEWKVRSLYITDNPRFKWRGMMLDSARYFQPVEEVKRFLDMMAMMKMNRMHWHLTDDQGWRIEIKKYPELTKKGSCRTESIKGSYYRKPREYDGVKHCGFYSQNDIREIVAYAESLYITIVPEIETVGHSTAAIVAYPEIGVTDEELQVSTIWGVHPHLMNAEDSTVQFVKDILDEVMALFPSQYIHIGGDEAIKDQWIASSSIQKRIKQLGLADEHELQAWFIRQLSDHLNLNGRKLVGWDEIIDGGLAKGAAVMAWRGDDKVINGVELGAKVISAPTHSTYLDYYQAQSSYEQVAIGGYLPLEKVYQWKLIPEGVNMKKVKSIIGGQAQLWTEYLPTMQDVIYMALPRGCAAAEVLWSTEQSRDFNHFLSRMIIHQQRMVVSGLNPRLMGGVVASGELSLLPTVGDKIDTSKIQVESLSKSGYGFQLRIKQAGVKVTSTPPSSVQFKSTGVKDDVRISAISLIEGGNVVLRLEQDALLSDFNSHNTFTFNHKIQQENSYEFEVELTSGAKAELTWELKQI